jgi:hypothetical protein
MPIDQTELPQLDESRWRAWRERNEAGDRTSVKRMMVALLVTGVAVVIATAAWSVR